MRSRTWGRALAPRFRYDESMAADALPDLANLELAAIEQAFADAGLPRFRARQVFHWIYRKGVTDFEKLIRSRPQTANFG